MQKYIVIVHGENLLADYNGVRQRLGFFTNVSVEALTPGDAEGRVIAVVREDTRYGSWRSTRRVILGT